MSHFTEDLNSVLYFLNALPDGFKECVAIEAAIGMNESRAQTIYRSLQRKDLIKVDINVEENVNVNKIAITREGRNFIEQTPFEKTVSELISEQLNIPYKQRAMVYEPTIRNILYLIALDKNTFNAEHWIELIKIHNSDKEKYPRLGETIRVVTELATKKYILLKGLTTKITLTGQLYRLYTHPSLGFWAIILAIVAIIVSLR